jgi:hypothetical protein
MRAYTGEQAGGRPTTLEMSRIALIAVRDLALAAAAIAAVYAVACASESQGATRLPPPVAISVAPSENDGSALYPGRSVGVRATLTNNTNHRLAINPRTIEASVSKLPRGCRRSWFAFAADTRQAAVVSANGGTATVRGTLTLVDAATDQSACSDAALTLSLSVRY